MSGHVDEVDQIVAAWQQQRLISMSRHCAVRPSRPTAFPQSIHAPLTIQRSFA